MSADEAPGTELRALYQQWEQAPTPEARQELWNVIVAHLRNREVRVGTQAEAERAAVVEEHKRRRFWLF